jgi:proteasome lid subunit RPN8/RPN11
LKRRLFLARIPGAAFDDSHDMPTGMNPPIQIPANALRQVETHALREYPNECCGLMLGPASRPHIAQRLRECVNAQDVYHRRDPVAFPRTGRNNYFIDPAELLAIERDRAAREEAIRVIYHSHCDADAYFSREDVRRALFEGEPVYPGAAYLIVSIRAEEMAGIKIFHWRRELRRFVSECGELARD